MKTALTLFSNYYPFIGFAIVYFTSLLSQPENAVYYSLWTMLVLNIAKLTYDLISNQLKNPIKIFSVFVLIIFLFIAILRQNFFWLAIGLGLTYFLSNLAVSILLSKSMTRALYIMSPYNIQQFTHPKMVEYIKTSFQKNYLIFVILFLIYAIANIYSSTYFVIGIIFINPILVLIINTRYYDGYYSLADKLKLLK